MSKITFRADDDLVERLEALDTSKSEAMREALRTYLDGADRDDGLSDTGDAEPVLDLDEESPSEGRSSDSIDDVIRDRVDELVAKTSGKHTLVFKIKIFTLGSAAIGLVGGFWATYNGGIVPNMFELQILLLIWIGMILGGNRRLSGLVVGAFVIFSLRIGTRFVSVPFITETQFASLRGVVIGLMLILIILYRPQGLLGNSKEIL